MNIKWIGSPNYDTSRKPIKEVVIHWIVGNLSAADATFQKASGVSAHYGIEDETIHQYVLEENTAYAVGVYYRNQETISIEHSASPDRPASNATYSTSAKLIADICQRYNLPIDKEHIIGHNQIKATQCPGTMDIDRLIMEARNINSAIIAKSIAKLTDQTLIPAILLNSVDFPVSEDKEIQALRGILGDYGRSQAELTKLKSLYQNAQGQLQECENRASKPLEAPKKPVDDSDLAPDKVVEQAPIIDALIKWFRKTFGD